MIRAFLILCGCLIAFPVSAWNGFGHMVVAEFAWRNMTPASQARAIELLKLNPMYEAWVQGVPANERDEFAFVKAATWADEIKGAQGYSEGNGFSCDMVARSNQDYESDKVRHRDWHFIDIPFSPDGSPLLNPDEPNAQTCIITYRDLIKSSSESDTVKSYGLVWLLHLVGDVHQPLHATSRFTKDDPDGDRGGNDIKVSQCSCGGNLHSFWDGALGKGNSGSLQKVQVQADKLKVPGRALATNTDVGSWVRESFNSAKTHAYAAPIEDGDGPYALTQTYKTQAFKEAAKRGALGGVRLAHMLDEALK